MGTHRPGSVEVSPADKSFKHIWELMYDGLLQVKDLDVHYLGSMPSSKLLTINAGEIVTLIGANGLSKSATLRLFG